MLYDISLNISYDYASAADASRQVLRLMPADLPGEQRLVAGSLAVEPKPDEWINRADFFGNAVVEVAFDAPHDEIIFKVQARVERQPGEEGLDVSPELPRLLSEIGECRDLDAASPHHFTGPSALVPPDPHITAYARGLARPGMTAYQLVKVIGQALHRDMRFDPEATTVDTPAAEAFARRHGVCQDFSHVMICALRGLGIPAGYVSGFLRTIPPEGKARLEGADAMHAWVRAWCGVETGWVEFDPTNDVFAGADHIVVARGRDYSDVAPVKGVMRIAGSHTTDHKVDVVPISAVTLPGS
jgi:transglutaminase-like putative cysteine protease